MDVLEEYLQKRRREYVAPMQALLDELNLTTGKTIALDRSLEPGSYAAEHPSPVTYRVCDPNAPGAARTLVIRICEFGFEEDRLGNWRLSAQDAAATKSAIEEFFDASNNELNQIVDIPAGDR
ncbi:MAG TPA: hypothetical protein VL523_01170 [Terriglobia bacterium]|nr:hypothetical protein [Terriglobia bacterium]